MEPSKNLSSKDSSKLWKLLSSGDKDVVAQGMELAQSIGAPFDESFLEGISVSERSGELVRNNRFSGTSKTQTLLDHVLLQQLSLAESNTFIGSIRAKVKKVSIRGIPVLRGFIGLESLEIQLDAPDNVNQAMTFRNLEDFGPLPSLKTLKIEAVTLGTTGAQLQSLSGLEAHSLEVAEIGNLNLACIEALSICKKLKKVNISGSTALTSIVPLENSAATLEYLDLSDCSSLRNLDPLKKAQKLSWLKLDGCIEIRSLVPLCASKELKSISFDNLPELMSFEGLSAPFITTLDNDVNFDKFSIEGCSSLETLEGLPPLSPSIKKLTLSGLDSLTSLRGLAANRHLEKLTLREIGALECIEGIQSFESIRDLSLLCLKSLTDPSPLAAMPSLRDLELSDCSGVEELPTSWKSLLDSLKLIDCDALHSLGKLPQSLSLLKIGGCKSLTSLKGVEYTSKLHLTIESSNTNSNTKAAYLEDLYPLANIPDLQINFQISGPFAQNRYSTFPEDLARALAIVPNLKLAVDARIRGMFSGGSRLEDGEALGLIRSLHSLDLRECRKLRDLRWLLNLPELSSLSLNPGSEVAKLAGSSKYSSKDEIERLKKRLSTKYEVKLPPLNEKPSQSSKKPLKINSSSIKGKDVSAIKKILKQDDQNIEHALELIRSLNDDCLTAETLPHLTKALANLLSGNTTTQVKKAVDLLSSNVSPVYAPVFDSLVDGVDIELAYVGDSQAIGTIFKNVKKPDRELARWALTWILSLAPDEATVAVSIRKSLKEVDLVGLENFDVSIPPPLRKFTALEKVRFEGMTFTTLDFLNGVATLQELNLVNCSSLISLKGLESSAQLKELSIYGSPMLTDLSALSQLPKLEGATQRGFFTKNLNLDSCGYVSDLAFVKGLRGVREISLKISTKSDTKPFFECPWIEKVILNLQSWNVDLSSFHLSRSLDIRSGNPRYRVIATLDAIEGNHDWNYEFTKLNALTIRGGLHVFENLRAPQLEDLSFYHVYAKSFKGLSGCRNVQLKDSTIGSFEGMGSVRELDLLNCNVMDFRGIESSEIERLDLSQGGSYSGLESVGKIQSLRALKLGIESSTDLVKMLPPCPQVRSLHAPGFSGSVSWFSAWTGLEELDLRDSGPLVDLDCLIQLTSLKKIRIRGASTKKDAWPQRLREVLDAR